MRIRLLHPEFFTDAVLAQCSDFARLVFAGLWLIADREGRLLDNVKMIDGLILPRDRRSSQKALDELAHHHRIRRYMTPLGGVIQIINFLKYQHPHPKEKPSPFPGRVGGVASDQASDSARKNKLLDPSVIDPVTSDGPPGLSQRNRDRARASGHQTQRRRVAADAHAARGASAPVGDDLVKKVFG